MMLLTIADVIGSLFDRPVLGVEELVALWASILLAFSLPAAHTEKAHVGVDLIYVKLPRSIQKINDIVITSISCILFLLISWQCYLYAKELRASGEVSMTLQFPVYLLIFGVAFALLIKSVVIFFEIFTFTKSKQEKQ